MAPSDDTTPEASPCKTRKMSGNQSKTGEKDTCLFCDSMDGELHSASTFSIDHTVRQYAIKLKDTNLRRKNAAGDLVAIEAKYHKSCMTKLFHDARDAQKSSEETDISSFHGISDECDVAGDNCWTIKPDLVGRPSSAAIIAGR